MVQDGLPYGAGAAAPQRRIDACLVQDVLVWQAQLGDAYCPYTLAALVKGVPGDDTIDMWIGRLRSASCLGVAMPPRVILATTCQSERSCGLTQSQ